MNIVKLYPFSYLYLELFILKLHYPKLLQMLMSLFPIEWYCDTKRLFQPLLVASILTLSIFSLNAQNRPFITTWKTDNPGTSDSSSILIPTHPFYSYNYEVDWDNDGIYDTAGVTGDITHQFDSSGVYTIQIRGKFPSILFDNGKDKEKIQSIDQWGDIEWENLDNAFAGTTHLTYNAMDVPDLSRVKNLSGMFWGAKKFNGDISAWDVSNIENMRYMFQGAIMFNQDIGAWDVSNVEDMSGMFKNALSFNQDIGNWNVSNVRYMDYMFSADTSFNQDIGAWDVSNVEDMSGMFKDAISFNQDIGNWEVSSVIYMDNMFSGDTSFNQDIGSWDVSRVEDMSGMFELAISFNQDIGSWDMSNVRYTNKMFAGYGQFTTSFNQNIGSWDVSAVEDMSNMFESATSFNQDIGDWDVSKVSGMFRMFSGATSFNQDIGKWDVSGVQYMDEMFYYATAFNQDIGNWDVSNVTNMEGLFALASSFNQGLEDWDVSKVVFMNGMFFGASQLDFPLGSWNIGQAEIYNMLSGTGLSTQSYDSTLIGWDSQGFVAKNLGDVSGLTYCKGGTARDNLFRKGWKLSGDALMCGGSCSSIANAGRDTSYCFGDENITLCAMEQDSVIYSWESGSSSLMGRCVDLTAGQWILTVTDSLGCTEKDTINISRYSPIEVKLSEDSTVTISGGTLPYDTVFSPGVGILKVLITDGNGCTGQDSLITTPAYLVPSTTVNIYPNPVHDVLTIHTSGYDSYEVILFDQYGRKIFHDTNTMKMDVSSYDPGIYYLQIISRLSGLQNRHFSVVIMR